MSHLTPQIDRSRNADFFCLNSISYAKKKNCNKFKIIKKILKYLIFGIKIPLDRVGGLEYIIRIKIYA